MAASFNLWYPFFLSEGDGDRESLCCEKRLSPREEPEAPRERGRGAALCHGPGESLITNGEGSGVMSPSAFSDGEESSEAGDSEPTLCEDQAFLRWPWSCIAIGAVADCRSDSLPLPSRMGGLCGVWWEEKSVWRVRPVEGARIW